MRQIQRIDERRLTSRVFPGDITHRQAFVHLDDVVEAIWLAAQRRAELPPELVLLIGEDETLSYDELQRRFGRLIHDEEWKTKEIPKAAAKTGAWLQDIIPGEHGRAFIKPWRIDLADNQHAGYHTRAADARVEPMRSLRVSLPCMVEAIKCDPAHFYRENMLGEPPHLPAAAHPSESAGEHA